MSPKLLPLINTRHGSRSFKTCEYRCSNQCDAATPNTSDNEEFVSLAQRALARRSVLKGSAATMVLGALAASPAAAQPAAPTSGNVGTYPFTPVAPNRDDKVTNAKEFTHNVIIRWGDPVTARAPKFDVNNQTPAAQAQQFGYNNDYVGLVALDGRRALLSVNHEYTDPELMFPTGKYDDVTKAKIEMAAHGLSVVQIQKGAKVGSWVASAPGRYNRRITAETPFTFDGPAAGHKLLQTAADPAGKTVLGTFANCSGGTTPWGTTLSGEENFHGYFEKSGDLDATQADAYKRYGVGNEKGRGWAKVDERFDLTKTPNEANRFGWVIEVDPLDPTATPVKHTMLGRLKHEGCNVAIAPSGHVVAYSGDDEKGEYIYKFVSRDTFNPAKSPAARRHNKTLLSAGTLYVGKFTGDGEADGVHDGTGTWIPLTSDTKSYVDGMSVAEVLINTRLAADKVGPTKMDRPEDIEPNPVNGKVYCALTNNSNRGSKHAVDEANPLGKSMVRKTLDGPLTEASGNRNGYLLEITEGAAKTGTSFEWDLMLVCGDPSAQETYFAGFPKDKVSPISCPDNVAFDAQGNLWISTDGNVLGSNDGLFRVPTSGPERGKVEQFLTVPFGAETCGPLVSPDQMSVFTAVQHPGETDDASFEKPASTWPHTDTFPRPSVIVSYAIDAKPGSDHTGPTKPSDSHDTPANPGEPKPSQPAHPTHPSHPGQPTKPGGVNGPKVDTGTESTGSLSGAAMAVAGLGLGAGAAIINRRDRLSRES